MTPFVYHNGAVVPAAEAAVGVYDGGWLHGAGLFETMRAEQRRVFRVESHIERMRRSAAEILRPIERAELPSRVDFLELLDRNELDDARVRLTVSAGSMLDGEGQGNARLTVCATAAPLSPLPAELYRKGVQVAICNHRLSNSDPVAGHKTTSYLPRLLGLREARRGRCVEAIWFTTQNLLAEGCISNVFLVRGGMLLTPALDTPVLPGIARGVVLELAQREAIEVREGALTINDLLDADEVFLTNAIMEVLPVVRVEQKDIGMGEPGAVARRLIEGYRGLVRKECSGE
jgi:branched-subunit amino acid aminotransferase/4-amino-4-deoxychorismate lyase